jgi:hypothetical protein
LLHGDRFSGYWIPLSFGLLFDDPETMILRCNAMPQAADWPFKYFSATGNGGCSGNGNVNGKEEYNKDRMKQMHPE